MHVEFTMKDAYSLDRDVAGLDEQYARMFAAYDRIFSRCGLPTIAVGADVGMMGGFGAHEIMYLAPIGEDTLVLCDGCGYAENRQVAVAGKPRSLAEEQLPIERVDTPGVRTIDALATLMCVPKGRTAKVVFLEGLLQSAERAAFVIAVIRGDTTLNETKLAERDWRDRSASDDERRDQIDWLRSRVRIANRHRRSCSCRRG